jgi:hypothetical protein
MTTVVYLSTITSDNKQKQISIEELQLPLAAYPNRAITKSKAQWPKTAPWCLVS